MADWLELELAERLSPVAAPQELWDRVARAAAGPVKQPRFRLAPPAAVPIAAVATLILAGALWFLARGGTAPPAYRQAPVAARAESCALCHLTL